MKSENPNQADSTGTPRVLHVVPWSGANRGGVEIAVQRLAVWQREGGADARILTPELGKVLPRSSSGLNGAPILRVKCPSIPHAPSGLRDTAVRRFLTLNLFRTIRHLRPDIVHCHYLDDSYPAIGLIATKIGVPYIMEFCGSDLIELQRSVQPYHEFLRGAAAITAVSEHLTTALADTLQGWTGRSAIRTLHRGIDTPRGDIRRRGWTDRGGVLFVGSLLPVKGPDLLGELSRALKRLSPQDHLVVVGDGPLREQLEVALPEAIFCGRVSGDEVTWWMNKSKVLVLPSRSEGLAGVALEAQMLGLPVVAFRVGGIPEAVQDGVSGRLVPPQDAHALAAAVTNLLRDPLAWEVASVGAWEWARSAFGRAGYLDRVSSLYAECIARKKASGLNFAAAQ